MWYKGGISFSYMPRYFFHSETHYDDGDIDVFDTLYKTKDMVFEQYHYFNMSLELAIGMSYHINKDWEARFSLGGALNIRPIAEGPIEERFYNLSAKVGLIYNLG